MVDTVVRSPGSANHWKLILFPVSFFPAKVDSAFHPYEVGKWVLDSAGG